MKVPETAQAFPLLSLRVMTMQQALDRNILDRLIDLGQRQGQLTTADLRATLPVEAMSAEEIAQVVVQLEERGVAVELETALLNPQTKSKPIQAPGAEIIPFPDKATRLKRSRPESAASKAILQIKERAPESGEAERHPVVHWVVAAAGLLAFAGLILIIFASSI